MGSPMNDGGKRVNRRGLLGALATTLAFLGTNLSTSLSTNLAAPIRSRSGSQQRTSAEQPAISRSRTPWIGHY